MADPANVSITGRELLKPVVTTTTEAPPPGTESISFIGFKDEVAVEEPIRPVYVETRASGPNPLETVSTTVQALPAAKNSTPTPPPPFETPTIANADPLFALASGLETTFAERVTMPS